MSTPPYPTLYELHTRVCLRELGRRLRRPATLDDIPDSELERLARMGFDWVWLLSVWQTGKTSRECSRKDRELRGQLQQILPDLQDEDISGSGFAITSYTVHEEFGGNGALARLRGRMQGYGLKLMLDFVPNHTALDHPWVQQHPEFYVHGSASDLVRAPGNYTLAKGRQGSLLLAHGRDPYFPAWTDTLQLNYANNDVQGAMAGELLKISEQCDGVRCDMAMLVLPEVFQRTWGLPVQPFWPKAISAVRRSHPECCFLAEVYWDLELTLQQQGFDYAYDKRLYDLLREGHARPVREHLRMDVHYQSKLARFLENHDEPRAAATFSPAVHEAAAVLTFLSPGLRFFHQGQLEGRLKRISPHLNRASDEPVNEPLRRFYRRVLSILRRPEVRRGEWRLLECAPAWEGNGSWDAFIASAWETPGQPPLFVAVNYAAHRSQCYARLPLAPGPRQWRFEDLLGAAHYERDGSELQKCGLYLDLEPMGFHVFEASPV